MSKSSFKTKTVLTMTDMTESTELQAFRRPRDDYKVTVKISLCICVVVVVVVIFFANCSYLFQLTMATSRRTMYIP